MKERLREIYLFHVAYEAKKDLIVAHHCLKGSLKTREKHFIVHNQGQQQWCLGTFKPDISRNCYTPVHWSSFIRWLEFEELLRQKEKENYLHGMKQHHRELVVFRNPSARREAN